MHTTHRLIGILLLGLLGAVAVAAAVALLLPDRSHVERSIDIEAPPATVFALVDSFRLFSRWSPWDGSDPTLSYRLEGPAHGVGAAMFWHSEAQGVGGGSQRIVESEPFRLVRIDYDFGGRGLAEAVMQIEPSKAGARLTWSLDTEHGWNLVARYFGLAFEKMVGPDLERGLTNLKRLAESLPGTDWSDLQVEVVELGPIQIAVTSAAAGPDHGQVAPALAAAYARVADFMRRQGLEQAGPPVTITQRWDPDDGWFFHAGIPIDAAPANQPDRDAVVRIGQTPEGTTVVATHAGPYEGLAAVNAKLGAYLAAYGLEEAGPRWEQYVSDPATTPADQLVTRVCVPVR